MIEVNYRGYMIRFNENSDEWWCGDLSGKSYASPKLSTVKAAIDRMLLSVRKESAVTCFEIGGGYTANPYKVEAKIVEFIKTKQDHDWKGNPRPPVHIVASVAQRSGSSKASRREVNIADLMPDTPEAHAAFERLLEAAERERIATQATKAAFDAIPRVTLDMISNLVKIAEVSDD